MSMQALQMATDVKRAGLLPVHTRSPREAVASRAWRPSGEHELQAAATRRASLTRCACGCDGACGATHEAGDEHEHDLGATRDPEGSEVDGITTAGELEADAGPLAADAGTPTPVPAPAPTPTPTPTPAPATSNCSVKSGPAYSPTGAVPVTTSGGRKKASFSMSATFNTDTAKKAEPRCCEVHQFIKWDKAFHDKNGGPPHGGFPSGTSYDTWIEDRDSAGKRYGHRSDSFSDPISSCGDEYKKGGARDQANGDTYCGKDAPGVPDTYKGKFEFQLKVVDTCNSDAEKASSSVISVTWG